MPTPSEIPPAKPAASTWSNRILLASVAGILFLTLFPFRFSIHGHFPPGTSPFLLGKSFKRTTALDFSLNVLLFIPFGFGLSARFRERNKPWAAAILASMLVGAFFSYAIEFIQLYIPLRDSGWEDIVSNSLGSFVGALLCFVFGDFSLGAFSRFELWLESRLTVSRVTLLLLVFLAVSVAVSAPLQSQTSLSNWSRSSFLFVGNDASLEIPWKGQISRLQIYDRAIPGRLARELTSGDQSAPLDPAPIADFDFSSSTPLHDLRRRVPDLSWASRSPLKKPPADLVFDGNSWLTSNLAAGFSTALQATKQFSLRVVCHVNHVTTAEGGIVVIAQPQGTVNLGLWQEGPNLDFWFRNPLTTSPWRLRWSLTDTLATIRPRDILITYDGANLSFFVDGRKDRRSSQLGPGVSLAHLFGRAKPGEVQIYNDIFYVMVFFPAGCFLGLAFRRPPFRIPVAPVLLACFLAPVALELLLVHVSGRAPSYGDIARSALLVVAGALWVNADRRWHPRPAQN